MFLPLLLTYRGSWAAKVRNASSVKWFSSRPEVCVYCLASWELIPSIYPGIYPGLIQGEKTCKVGKLTFQGHGSGTHESLSYEIDRDELGEVS